MQIMKIMAGKMISLCLVMLLLTSLCISIPTIYANGLELQMHTDKDSYKPGEELLISLKFDGVSQERTNSLGVELAYDQSVFELLNNNPEDCIANGYIPFNLKGINKEGNLEFSFVSMTEDIALKQDSIVATLHFIVTEDIVSETGQIYIKNVEMLDSDFNSYMVGLGEAITITIVDSAESEEQASEGNTSTRPQSSQRGRITQGKREDSIIPFPEPIKEPLENLATSFKDLENHWAKVEIQEMAGQEIVKGVDADNFMPDAAVKRAEFAAFIVRALKLNELEYQNIFEDVLSTDWYADVIAAAWSKGIVSGFEGKFRPNSLITREEMTKMIVEAYKVSSSEPIKLLDNIDRFKDLSEISSWALDYVKEADSLELIKGVTEQEFSPKSHASRAQAVVMIKRLMDKLASEREI